MKPWMLCVGLVAAAATLPGCIAWEIRDELVASNDTLGAINTNLASIDERLDTIDAKLAAIDGELKPINDRLTIIRGDLDAVNAHLASLRKTINNIDSTIPFLSISGDSDEEQETLKNPEAADDEPRR